MTYRYTEVDKFWDSVVESLKLRHEVSLQGHRVLREILDPLRQFPKKGQRHDIRIKPGL